MGGLALKHTDIRRYEKKEFFDLFEEIKSILPCEFIPRLLQAFREKETFGDMDIMIYAQGLKPGYYLKETIQELFNPTDIISNSNVISFDYKNLQIDFIIVSHENWDSAYNFLKWNDMGNFLGKISKAAWGLKYGDFGLKYVYRSYDQSRILGEITLTKNPVRILSFLGLNYDRWAEGFDTEKDIFDYIITSKYYNPQFFQWEELSALHKKRNKRRKMYHEFLDYTEGQDPKDFYQRNKDQNFRFNYIEQNFPGFLNQVAEYDELDRRRKVVRDKFNGNLVNEYYGLDGKELGDAIINFKKSFNFDGVGFNDWIYRAHQPSIWKLFEIINEKSGVKLEKI